MELYRFDALILTALLDELEPVLAFGGGSKSEWLHAEDPTGFPYYFRELERTRDGRPLRIAAASFNEMGQALTASRAAALIHELNPACLAMCGICAGNKKDVALGDVIVADRVYNYEHGKLVAWRDEDGQRRELLYHDVKTYNLEAKWMVNAAYFARELSWTAELVKSRPLSREVQQWWLLRALLDHEQDGAVAPDEHPERDTHCPDLAALWDQLRLPEHGLLVNKPGVLSLTELGRGLALEVKRKYRKEIPRDRDFKIHVGPIATGSVVQKDPELFDRLERLVRKTLGVEMEAMAIALASEQLNRRAIIVKAAADHGDGHKDDSFRKFAARASAEVLLRFLLQELEPSVEAPPPTPERYSSGPDVSIHRNPSRHDDLLSRVQEIAELRIQASQETTEIRRFRARPPVGSYLRVTTVKGPFRNTFPLAAVEQVTPETLDIFLTDIDAPYRRQDVGVRSTLVHGGPPPPAELAARAAATGVLLQSFIEYQGLIDFTHYLERQLQRLETDSIYPPTLYVPQRAEFESGSKRFETTDALEELLRLLESPLSRFVAVLGDFGTGKTFLLHELARRMTLARGPLIPLLIELRTLEKKTRIDALIAQHLTMAGMERVDMPAFRYMLAEGRIVLLFDGFDELALRVSYERAADHLSALFEAAQGDAKIVITSRRTHFLSDQQVREKLGQGSAYHLASLKPFTDKQIKDFLLNLLGDTAEARRRFELLSEVKDLRGLSHNPRMLGFIADISERELLEAKERAKTITSSTLYDTLLRRWLKEEVKRAHPPGIEPGLSEMQRWKAVTALAMLLWRRGVSEINLNELPGELKLEVEVLADHKLEAGLFKHQVGSGTLLVRHEGEKFSFIHQSVLEWLVAKEVARELKESGTSEVLGLHPISQLMADFVWGLAGRSEAEQWAQDALFLEEATSTARKNAMTVLVQLGVEARDGMRLAKQDLRDRDFSRMNLRRADLTDALLAGVSLAGADLTGARLAGAMLQRADLSRANLEYADLSDADLTGARLLGVSLVGTKLERTRLQEAKLIGATVDPHLLEGREQDLFGAAKPDSGPAVPMVSAASWCFAVTYSPDGRFLATGHDGSIRLWSVESGTERRVLQGHEGAVWAVAFSPDGKTLASSSDDSTVRLWDVATGTLRLLLDGHEHGVLSLAFSPDGMMLASGSEDATVRLWDVNTGAHWHVFGGDSRCISSVAFSPDGALLASGSTKGTIVLWDVAKGTQRREIMGHSKGVLSVAFSRDGKTLASGSEDATVRLWDVNTGTLRRELSGHSQSVLSVAYSRDGRTLASGSEDTTIRLWELATYSERRIPSRVLMGHGQRVYSVAFSPDGKTLASGSEDTAVRLWSLATDAERRVQVRVLRGHAQRVLSVAFAPDGKTLALGSEDTTLRLWDVASGSERLVLSGHAQSVWSVAYSPVGQVLASGSEDATVRTWNLAASSERRAIGRVLKGHSQSVYSVAFSPDGRTLASGSADGTLRLWDVESGSSQRGVIEGHSQSVYGVAFSPDGRTLASGSEDNTVCLWNVATGIPLRTLKGHSRGVLGVAFSRSGKLLASGSEDSSVRLWDVGSGIELRVLQGHSQSVLSVAFSNDRKMFASGSEDTSICLWDIISGAKCRVLKGHSQRVVSVAFSPKGKLLASASTDGTVRLWKVSTGECLAVLVSLPEGWVAFTPDGHYRSRGTIEGAFWHAINLCRFEVGELEAYLPAPLRVRDEAPLYLLT